MSELEHEEVLRRALRTAADSVEPAGDGLSRIRERLTAPRPLMVAWLMAAGASVSRWALFRLEPAYLPAARKLRPVWGFLHASSASRPSRLAWLRPAIAIGLVFLVAVVGGFAISSIPRQFISSMAQSVFQDRPAVPSGSGKGSSVSGNGSSLRSQAGSRHRRNKSAAASPSASRSAATARPSTSMSPSPSPSVTSSPSPSPSPSGTTISPSPSPSPSPTTSPSPSPSPSPSASSAPSSASASSLSG